MFLIIGLAKAKSHVKNEGGSRCSKFLFGGNQFWKEGLFFRIDVTNIQAHPAWRKVSANFHSEIRLFA